MNRSMVGLVVVLGVGGVATASSSYNRLVPYEEAVNSSYAEYQNQLKRQADLIPNFAEVVKSYMTHEQRTMVDSFISDLGSSAGEGSTSSWSDSSSDSGSDGGGSSGD